MRLIGSLPTHEEALRFATFLKTQNITCVVEKATDYQLWIVEEDHLDEAVDHLAHFQENPTDPRYQKISIKQTAPSSTPLPRRPASLFTRSPPGKLIITLIILCVGLFVWGLFQERDFQAYHKSQELGLPLLPPVYTILLYDYPKALADIQALAAKYTPEQLKDPSTLPPAEQKQIATTLNTPWYQGLYTKILRLAQDQPPLAHGPLFQKIGEGQVWRIITPIFLHGGFLHILFNLIWLWVLGNQIEERIGIWRLTLLVLFGAALSNTAQYLMSGPLFFGMSGVVLTLFAFLWVRQKKAPWEGYLLNKLIIAFISIWILGIAALQVVLFFFQLAGNGLPPIGIANTAHIVGALAGALCGSLNLFSAK